MAKKKWERIKLLINLSGEGISVSSGTPVEMDADNAKRLIDAGKAEPYAGEEKIRRFEPKERTYDHSPERPPNKQRKPAAKKPAAKKPAAKKSAANETA